MSDLKVANIFDIVIDSNLSRFISCDDAFQFAFSENEGFWDC